MVKIISIGIFVHKQVDERETKFSLFASLGIFLVYKKLFNFQRKQPFLYPWKNSLTSSFTFVHSENPYTRAFVNEGGLHPPSLKLR